MRCDDPKLHLKFALVHDRFAVYTGSEKVVEAIFEMFPLSMYTLFANPEVLKKTILEKADITESFVRKLPNVSKWYQAYLPLFPIAIEQFDFSNFDVILSSSHTVAKGVLTNPDQLHICYCHTPMRYAWDLYHDYLKDSRLQKGIKGVFAQMLLHYLRMWDVVTVPRVDHFIANSRHVSRRIKKIYGRDSIVIYPPVDVDKFSPCFSKENYYVTVSRLVSYKKVDIIVEAFSEMPDRKLVVIGDGPEMDRIKRIAPRNVDLLGRQPDEVVVSHLQKAKAFLFAAEEDFGIVPVEAQSCGTPVIAYSRGGVQETVVQGKTGILFDERSVRGIMGAVEQFERRPLDFDPSVIRNNAERFSKARFQAELRSFVDDKIRDFFPCSRGHVIP